MVALDSTQQELVEQVSLETGYSTEEVLSVVTSFRSNLHLVLESFKGNLPKDFRINVVGIGSFYKRKLKHKNPNKK